MLYITGEVRKIRLRWFGYIVNMEKDNVQYILKKVWGLPVDDKCNRGGQWI